MTLGWGNRGERTKDPFRTLDDPEPAPSRPAPEPSVRALGYWRLPAKRPGRLRRFVVWVLLGWKWK